MQIIVQPYCCEKNSGIAVLCLVYWQAKYNQYKNNIERKENKANEFDI